MNLASRILLGIGTIAVAAAIGFDAWHAHGLQASLEPDAHAAFGRGIRLHYIAGIGMILAGIVLERRPHKLTLAAGVAIALGGVIFCSEVYRGALGQQTFGFAPQGGSLSILGWFAFGISALLPDRQRAS